MTALFYDELAPFYHLLYEDWDAAIRTQGAALADLLEAHGARAGSQILDAACGIGTQALGLAGHGYRLTASDVSAGAVARLLHEADKRGLQIDARVDDLKTLASAEAASMDAVVALDNSLPHLLSDDELLAAFRSALRVLKPDGIALYSVRDYAEIVRNNPDVRPYPVRYDGATRVAAVQVWDWHGDQYDLRLSVNRECPDGTSSTRVFVTRYYAVTIARLVQIIATAGFVEIERHDDVLFQPVILGRKRSAHESA